VPVAVTADIVGSRALDDRAAAQRTVEAAIADAESALPLADRAFRPTVGDEFQAIFPTLSAALAAVMLLRLSLPEEVDCRFGVGVGDVTELPSIAPGGVSEGPGWWAARVAIDHVHAVQQRMLPAARTWIVAAEDAASPETIAVANAYVLARDQLIDAMSHRTRRLARGRCLGRTQRELAAAEGITQSAVSQALSAAGVSMLVAGFRSLLA
jgi:hypothetical protein